MNQSWMAGTQDMAIWWRSRFHQKVVLFLGEGGINKVCRCVLKPGRKQRNSNSKMKKRVLGVQCSYLPGSDGNVQQPKTPTFQHTTPPCLKNHMESLDLDSASREAGDNFAKKCMAEFSPRKLKLRWLTRKHLLIFNRKWHLHSTRDFPASHVGGTSSEVMKLWILRRTT